MTRVLKPQIRLRSGRWEVVVAPSRGLKNIYCGSEGTFAEACSMAAPPSWWDEEREL